MTRLLIVALVLQFGSRPPLAPAETLLAPELLRTIERASVEGKPVPVIPGTDKVAGDVVLACEASHCEAVEWAMKRLASSGAPLPSRTIRAVPASASENTRAVVFVGRAKGPELQILRGLWSNASIVDEVVELFARHADSRVHVRAHEDIGQGMFGRVAITTIIPSADARGLDRASFVAAASAYFLATLPNAGAEALLSHLTVGAHARLAEDGRRAVAQMGAQQRASADVLIMFGQAIEREQRRIRSFEQFMPQPVDSMLRTRLADMERGITSVWTSMGITSSPFVPAAARIRGRGGDDRRVPSLTGKFIDDFFPPASIAKLPNANLIVNEMLNFIDGRRSISDVRDAVSSEFGGLPLPVVVECIEAFAKAGLVSLR